MTRTHFQLEPGGEGRLLALDVLVEPGQVAQQVVPHVLWLGQTMALSRVTHEDARNAELPQGDEVFFGLRDRYVHVLSNTTVTEREREREREGEAEGEREGGRDV